MRDQYGVVGNPVAHSRSPEIHAQFAQAIGQALEYRRIEAPLDGFEAAVDAFRGHGGKGLNVTVPFKESAYRYCARASERARQTEVVNTLVFTPADVYGDTTDGPGLVADLTRNLRFELRGRQVLLMGAGGAARGVVPSLLEAGVARLVVANRTVARAQALAARFPVEACGYAELEGERFDLVVNATSAGLLDTAPRLPASVFKPGALAYDMVYGRDTPFLLQA